MLTLSRPLCSTLRAAALLLKVVGYLLGNHGSLYALQQRLGFRQREAKRFQLQCTALEPCHFLDDFSVAMIRFNDDLYSHSHGSASLWWKITHSILRVSVFLPKPP